MNSDFPSFPPALSFSSAGGPLRIREDFGLAHARQIVEIACPEHLPENVSFFSLRDVQTGAEFPAQRSCENPAVAFLQIELEPFSVLELVLNAQPASTGLSVPVELATKGENLAVVSNGKWEVEIHQGKWRHEIGSGPSYAAPTPVRRLRAGEGPWRGNSFFETRQAIRQINGTVLESGPLRIVTQFQATIGESGFYTARLTFDADADHVRIDETFLSDSGDQIVWDFSGCDLPRQIHLLDSSAGFTTVQLQYFFDRRLARLACWNQYSQLHDFSDGYALTFAQSEDVIGYVVLEGGKWTGNSHNFLEAWSRRWLPNDPGSRRLVPAEAKADGAPSPERIAARPVNACETHFSVEGWLHRGNRSFALVLTTSGRLRSSDWNASPTLGHFELKPDRLRYRQQQSLLRRIHTQQGLFPLSEQLSLCRDWPLEKCSGESPSGIPPWENPDHFHGATDLSLSLSGRGEKILEFLAARVFGFWEGSGSAYTNAVVSRPLAPCLLDWEWLGAHGHLNPEQLRQGRAWFAFLIQLFSSDNFYPGAASMNSAGPGKSQEPAMAWMSNQNFFTDTFNLPGLAAQVFHSHPRAAAWRDYFGQMWRRQLEYHVYPESGVWEESHTYFHHVLHTVLPTLERRRDDGVEDGFSDPAFQRLVGSLLKLLTPKDSYYGGKRHVVALGDHGVDRKDLYRPLYRRLAGWIAPFDGKLASHLAWAYREMGGGKALSISPEAPPWQNEYVQGMGYFFRAGDATGESLLVLRSGNAWAHHHNDEGSLQFFAAGRAWIVDSAFSYPQKEGIRKVRADGHSRWSPRDFFPLNYLWQFNRGWITHHDQQGPFPCAVAFTPVYMAETSVQQYIPLRQPVLHWRGVIQLSPRAFLILDRSNVDLPQVLRFHLPLSASFTTEDSPPASAENSFRLSLRPLFGLRPAQEMGLDHPTQDGGEFSTRELLYHVDGGSVTALLIQVETGANATVVKENPGQNSVEIRHPDFHVSLLTNNPEIVSLTDLKTGRQAAIPLGNPTNE